jgi:hypothetical protein
MADVKTKQTEQSIDIFLDKVTDENLKKDCYSIIGLMEKAAGEPAKMWGPTIIGFGTHHYKYDSGREGDICLIGFSPRKANISLYLCNFEGRNAVLAKLGKHKTGKGCIYIKKLSDVDINVFESLIKQAADQQRNAH